jgi:hypothetical protein
VTTEKKCRQQTGAGRCDNHATHRFTWPGSDESVICDAHLLNLLGVAEAMGMHVQVIPLEPAPEREEPPHAV